MELAYYANNWVKQNHLHDRSCKHSQLLVHISSMPMGPSSNGIGTVQDKSLSSQVGLQFDINKPRS
jgi:hypothetical protein